VSLLALNRIRLADGHSTSLVVELLAWLFRTLGDATRLRLLELLLEEGELHQMELVQRLGATQAGSRST